MVLLIGICRGQSQRRASSRNQASRAALPNDDQGTGTYNKATEVTTEEGRVLLDEPDGVDIALTPDAALETGHRPIEGVADAAGKDHFAKLDQRIKP